MPARSSSSCPRTRRRHLRSATISRRSSISTGIDVTILTDDLPVVQQKVGIDLRGGKADYVLNYVQDKPIGAPFGEFYADMTPLFGDATLPQDPDGYGDDAWFENFLSACGRFYKEGKIVALPYDAAIACTFYRQDLFEANSKDFEAEYGYRLEFTPRRLGRTSPTWPLSSRRPRKRARMCPMAMPSIRATLPGRRSSTFSACSSPTAAGWIGISTTSMAARRRARPTGATHSQSRSCSASRIWPMCRIPTTSPMVRLS